MARSDVHLLFFGVAGNAQDFHAVAQRLRNSVEHVRRGDEDDFGEINRHFEIVILEGVILLRVEYFQ